MNLRAQILTDVQELERVTRDFADSHLANIFRRHPELPSATITARIDNSMPGRPRIDILINMHAADPAKPTATERFQILKPNGDALT
jgi:hypothetical protein